MQRRIFFNIVIVLLLGVIICGLLYAGIVKKSVLKNIEKSLVVESGLIRELVGESLINKPGEIDDYLNKIKQGTSSRITIIDTMGNVIADTESDYSTMDNHSERPEIAAALQGRLGKSTRFSSTLKVDFLYVAQPVFKGSSIVGAVRLSKPLYEINTLINELYNNAFIAILAGLAVASLLGYRMAVNITRPIKDITYTASLVAKGQLEKRVNIKGKDEIAILADSINNMASKLNETITSLQEKNLKLEAIMAGMVNGIIAIDCAKRVLFINPVAEKLLDIAEEDAVGKHLLQVVRNNSIDNYIKTVLQEKKFFAAEITIDNESETVLKLYSKPIKHMDDENIDGIIITVQDITELRKLEKIRTEFVANVSHELKTPLTSIKGFVETLKMEEIENRQDTIRFLNIIENEADRLYRLINDILSLSELEQRRIKLNKDSINIEKTVEEVLSIIRSQSDKKNISVLMEVQEGLCNLKGDKDKFKQMLINLVDNAIKYTQESGTVKVEAYNITESGSMDKVVIKVSDNGIGIPKQHIPRLFERFYRVDRARSRRIGGTGLGLAIVKHIVILFNGEIEVDSEVGKGTEFRIIIPSKD